MCKWRPRSVVDCCNYLGRRGGSGEQVGATASQLLLLLLPLLLNRQQRCEKARQTCHEMRAKNQAILPSESDHFSDSLAPKRGNAP